MRALDKECASPEVDKPRILERKVSESVLKKREEERLYGIMDSEDEAGFAATLTVDLSTVTMISQSVQAQNLS